MRDPQTTFHFPTGGDLETSQAGPRDAQTPDAADGALSVTALLNEVRDVVGDHFRRVVVVGEISGFRRHGSGHCYFVLKDDEAQIRAVLWRTTARRINLSPRDGLQVQIRGRIEVYPPRGEMQLVVDSMRPDGDGAAQAALEALKRKLHQEGLFSRSAKKTLPRFPERIGVVTSGSGAALHDITSVLGRRYPLATVIVRPVRVQGMEAPDELVRAIAEFNRVPVGHPARVDVLIVGRGGGSAEDLWSFNEEAVARAIFGSEIPIISAVGHETDVTIADFVADVRAATPSMAAELVAPDRAELGVAIEAASARLRELVQRRIEVLRQKIDYMTGSYHFRRTIDRLSRLSAEVAQLERRGRLAVTRIVAERKLRASSLLRQVHSVDPMRPLRSGYALVRGKEDGALLTSASRLWKGQDIELRFHDGTGDARVLSDGDTDNK